ncbi:PREDICTED: uncharacterized protein LOC105119561 [Populus euphratica]|uniref:Uncharacterized protein LOC105119561 n=1 Tax=Populus euphratica TaxID=75702 RepID=A0AAJ6XEV2_POPEU|nr:PREDICTED: uncharacterized protein LOC105119561 [Populus euphratica]
MDVSFREAEPYYSKGLPTTTFQGENFSQGNVLPEGGNDDGNNEFFKLEEIIERLTNNSTLEELPGGTNNVLELEAVTEMLGRSHTREGSPINIELPLLTPLPNEFTQNVEPQELLNPISNESNVISDKTLVSLESLVPRYSQRSNKGKRTIGCRWVFTVKLKADGNIDRYKARLVAKRYTQKYRVDYQETFALVVKLDTIRILLPLAEYQE